MLARVARSVDGHRDRNQHKRGEEHKAEARQDAFYELAGDPEQEHQRCNGSVAVHVASDDSRNCGDVLDELDRTCQHDEDGKRNRDAHDEKDRIQHFKYSVRGFG